jgi:hypothetical protein
MNLEELSDKEFRDLVDKELRRDHPQTSQEEKRRLEEIVPMLRSPQVIDRWISVLEVMKASSETQLGAKLAEIKKFHGSITQSDYENKLRGFQSWKAGNLRFLHSVQQRLLEARATRIRLFGKNYPTRLAEERDRLSQTLLRLIRAVEIHRETVLREYDPSDADEVLWEAIPEAA